VLIIPSSWGSQLDGDLHRQHRAASRTFSGTVAGEKEDFCKGVSHAHPLLCLLFCFTLFLLALFYQKYKKLVSFIVVYYVKFSCHYYVARGYDFHFQTKG
jgi:hypothetical protein